MPSGLLTPGDSRGHLACFVGVDQSSAEETRPSLLAVPHKPPPPRKPKPGELLFEVVLPRDRAIMRCDLRFYGESYGWEVQFFDGRGNEFFAPGGFVLRELAVRWAEQERDALLNER